jgi:hypothetical protein
VGSGIVLAIIVCVWAVFLLPTFLRKHDPSGKLQDVEEFREAMGQLSNLEIPQQPTKPKVEVKREIRAGHADPKTATQVRKRRKVFLATISIFPLTLVGIIFGILPVFAILIPFATFAGYVTWVRLTIKPRVADAIDENAPSQKYVRRSERNHRFAALAQLRKAAASKLTEEEVVLDTSKTSSWQSAPAIGAAFDAPETVLPTYVDAPAATSVPRVLDRENGAWDGDAMVQAAAVQRRELLAKLMAEQQEAVEIKIISDDVDTTEIPKVIGA